MNPKPAAQMVPVMGTCNAVQVSLQAMNLAVGMGRVQLQLICFGPYPGVSFSCCCRMGTQCCSTERAQSSIPEWASPAQSAHPAISRLETVTFMPGSFAFGGGLPGAQF